MKLTPSQKMFIAFCLSEGLPEPIPEFRFEPTRKWKADWLFEANGKRVALEIEGAVWTNGRHTRPKGFLGDIEKYNNLSLNGIYLLRVTPDNLLKTSTVEMLRKCLF